MWLYWSLQTKQKEKHKNCIIFYRLGDFYEMFFDDAITASRVLELTLTGKQEGLGEDEDLVPSHAVIIKAIESMGQDYRYQDSAHPIKELNNRKKDNTTIARTPC